MRIFSAIFLISILLVPVGRSQAVQGEPTLAVKAGSGAIIDSPIDIRRVAVSNGEIAEAVVASPREILVNGKVAGETNLVIWQQDGKRQIYQIRVLRDDSGLAAIRREIRSEFPDQPVALDFENGVPIVRGVASDITSANRILALASTVGPPVNLLKVRVPPTDPQILVRIRFANVDRSVSQALGMNLFSTGATNTVGSVTTQQFSPPKLGSNNQGATHSSTPSFALSEALNIFLFRPDLNLGATIQALASNNLLQILAEPNLLTLNDRPASFLAGGEFPFPTLQGGGAGLGAVTIQFREFGIRLNFTPSVTARGTIRLTVSPEVSSLDYANALVVQGYTIPALSTRRVSTEVELEDGQSFAIAGLLDNRATQNLSKIPGLGDIPLFGKLFQSRQITRSNTELIVVVTPEIVAPIPTGNPVPELKMITKFLPANTSGQTRTPPLSLTGRSVSAGEKVVPMEELLRTKQTDRADRTQPQGSTLQFIPAMVPGPAGQSSAPASPGTALPVRPKD